MVTYLGFGSSSMAYGAVLPVLGILSEQIQKLWFLDHSVANLVIRVEKWVLFKDEIWKIN